MDEDSGISVFVRLRGGVMSKVVVSSLTDFDCDTEFEGVIEGSQAVTGGVRQLEPAKACLLFCPIKAIGFLGTELWPGGVKQDDT